MGNFRQPDLTPGFLLSLAAAALLLPLRWCLAVAAAAAFHELCHWLALRLCGGQVGMIRFGIGGAVIRALPLPAGKALICTLAGPVGGLLLIPLARWFPRLALCAAIQSACNLLPVAGLDGGQALAWALNLFLPERVAEKICRVTEITVLAFLGAAGLWGSFFLELGPLPVLAAGRLILRRTNGKTPCKS